MCFNMGSSYCEINTVVQTWLHANLTIVFRSVVLKLGRPKMDPGDYRFCGIL